jgi:hypothetical protein
MFYEHPSFKTDITSQTKLESAIVVLEPAESKRLIARAVAALPEVKAALKKGILVIGWGSTNAYVAEEVLGEKIAHKADFTSGVISGGELNGNAASPETKLMPFVLKDGKMWKKEPDEEAGQTGSYQQHLYVHQKPALGQFKPGDVFIKGANAVDGRGDIGILVGADNGGSIAQGWFAVTARGGSFICPVGLEKLVPSVRNAERKCGIYHFKYSMGMPVAFIMFTNALVVTEIQAIQVLSGARATHVASGGIGGSEGAVTLVLEAEARVLEKAFEVVKGVKGEPPVKPPKEYAVPPAATLGYKPEAIQALMK